MGSEAFSLVITRATGHQPGLCGSWLSIFFHGPVLSTRRHYLVSMRNMILAIQEEQGQNKACPVPGSFLLTFPKFFLPMSDGVLGME